MISRQNNFDLVRLLAALQVVFIHSVDHLSLGEWASRPASVIGIFPGVPIFFFVSGFLISLSWERCPVIRTYGSNRLLRIYPALWACLLLTLVMIAFLRSASLLFTPSAATWVFAQASFLQFYNPDAFRDIGVGVVNGSLWTISIELQFYLLLPILMSAVPKKFRNQSLWVLFLLTLVFREWFIGFRNTHTDDIATKLIGVSIFPYLALFCVGILSQIYWTQIHKLFEGKVLFWFPAYAVWSLFCDHMGWGATGNQMSTIRYLPLAGLVLSFAFSNGWLAEFLLRGNDISYGIYLYHMLVINFVLEYELKSPAQRILSVFLVSTLFALFSWFAIERFILRLKKRSVVDRASMQEQTVQLT